MDAHVPRKGLYRCFKRLHLLHVLHLVVPTAYPATHPSCDRRNDRLFGGITIPLNLYFLKYRHPPLLHLGRGHEAGQPEHSRLPQELHGAER